MKRKNIAVFASGGGSNFQALIDAVKGGTLKANIALLVTHKEDIYAVERAKQNNIPHLVFKKDEYKSTDEMYKAIQIALRQRDIDYIVLAGYLSVLSAVLVDGYKERIINVHPSLIPKHCGMGYYGIKVHEAVLAAGDKETGATVHFVDRGVDTGKIIAQESVRVEKNDTPLTLQKRVLEVEHRILPRAVERITNNE